MRGPVRLLGRHNHSERMHRDTGNLGTKAQTHTQVNTPPARTALQLLIQRYRTTAHSCSLFPKCVFYATSWYEPCFFTGDNISKLTVLLCARSQAVLTGKLFIPLGFWSANSPGAASSDCRILNLHNIFSFL